MKEINMKNRDMIINNMGGNNLSSSSCTCLLCGGCLLCIAVPFFVGLVLTPTLTSGLLMTQNA